MSRRIPLFPLPGVVLLPGTLLPLHIFEPRYKTMVGDALAGNRTIGMAMLKPGWESRDANPAVYPVGGAGEIIESEALEDGRYNILLEGRFRYRILEEATLGPYRAASVEEIASVPFSTSGEERRINHTARKLFEVIRGELELAAIPETALSPERLASELALRLRYSPEELQTLLETDSVPARFGTLIGRMLEWHRRIRFLAPFRPPDLDVTRN